MAKAVVKPLSNRELRKRLALIRNERMNKIRGKKEYLELNGTRETLITHG